VLAELAGRHGLAASDRSSIWPMALVGDGASCCGALHRYACATWQV